MLFGQEQGKVTVAEAKDVFHPYDPLCNDQLPEVQFQCTFGIQIFPRQRLDGKACGFIWFLCDQRLTNRFLKIHLEEL